MKRQIIGGAAALLLAAGGVLGFAGAASAHTGGVTGVASCAEDGTAIVTWTYAATNVPDGVEAETKAMTTTPGQLAARDGVEKGGQIFLSVWSEHAVNVPGAPTRVGNWSATFATVGIPGDYVGKVTTMVQTDWKGGPSEDPVGEVTVPGDCEPPVVVPPKPEPESETRDEIIVDCDADTVTVTLYTRTREEPTYDEATNTWTPGEWGEWVAGTPETFPADDVECPPVVTPPTEEPPVVTPPTEEPPVVTPPTEEPPVVEEPTPTPTAPTVPAVDREEPPTAKRLAETGGSGSALTGSIGVAALLVLTGTALLVGQRITQRRRS